MLNNIQNSNLLYKILQPLENQMAAKIAESALKG